MTKIAIYVEDVHRTLYTTKEPFCNMNDHKKIYLIVRLAEDIYNIRRLIPYTQADASNHGGECSMPILAMSKYTSLISIKLVPMSSMTIL